MTVAIGWFGRNPINRNVAAVDVQPDRLLIAGRLAYGPGPEIQALLEQLMGLRDAKAQPVSFSDMPQFDGFYDVGEVQLGMSPGALKVGYWPYSVELTPVESHRSALFESRLLAKVRANQVGVTTAIHWHAVPGGSLGWSPSTGNAPITIRDVDTLDGRVRVYEASSLSDNFVSWRCLPADYLVGAARIDIGPVGTILQPTTIFEASDDDQTYTVPPDVDQLMIDVRGGGGGGFAGQLAGGPGARVTGEIRVTPGETLCVRVGRAGPTVWSDPLPFGSGPAGTSPGGAPVNSRAGAGGGYSGIFKSVPSTPELFLSEAVAVAGGGGGHNGWPSDGSGIVALGGGGGLVGAAGGGVNGTGGRGGRVDEGGQPGAVVSGSTAGTAGSAGQGGQGGDRSSGGAAGGGGGGGYFGGGGGSGSSSGASGAGGGGSSWAPDGLTATTTLRVEAGSVSITPVASGQVLDLDRYTHTGGPLIDSPYGWILSNQLVSVAPTFDGSRLALQVRGYGAEPRTLWLTDGENPIPATARIVSVDAIRTDPEMSILRLGVSYEDRSATVTAWLALRRGSPWVDVTIWGPSRRWGWATESDTAVVVSPNLLELPDTSTYLTFTHGSAIQWEDGAARIQSATTTNYAAGFGVTDEVDRWFSSSSETVRVVRP